MSEVFILNCKEKDRLYEALVENQENLRDIQEDTILENLVSPNKFLRSIRDKSDQIKIQFYKTLDYEEYLSLDL